MSILFLCKEKDLTKERRGYARALRKRGELLHVPDDFPLDGHLDALLRRFPAEPALIVHPEGHDKRLPRGITSIDIPTACFQIDTHRLTDARIRLSMLFDYTLLFQPGFARRFKAAGHPRPITLGHAVELEVFEAPPRDPAYDLAFVGRLDDSVYGARRRLLPRLAERFRMNDWRRRYTYEEMAEILRSSNVGVNIPRDDHLRDANLRCFEVMASGALLITPVPSGLSDLGFRDGEQFVGHRGQAELADLVRFYLDHDGDRRRIARAGRELVLGEHTYDRRTELLLGLPRAGGKRPAAPARDWPEGRQRLIYLRYYLTHHRFDAAWRELGGLRRCDVRSAVVGLSLIAEALARYVRARRALPAWKPS